MSITVSPYQPPPYWRPYDHQPLSRPRGHAFPLRAKPIAPKPDPLATAARPQGWTYTLLRL